MRSSTPIVRQRLLTVPGTTPDQGITVGTPAWYAWLESAGLFSFLGDGGTFTARKERRQRGGGYWKAYRTTQGKLARVYLGKAACLTPERLEQVALALTERSQLPQQEPGTPSPTYPEPLLSTKTTRPPLRPGLVVRPRLAQALQAHQHAPLILLLAPAGFGKTTLLSQWSAQSRRRVAWLSLDPADNDPIRFWRYLITALETVSPGIGQEALALLHSRQPVPLESVVTHLLNALASLSEEVLLIIDDYHLITLPSIHEALTWLLEHQPPTLHVVLASRTDPPLPLARLRVRHPIFEVRAGDLRFTPEEATTFFTTSQIPRLSAEQIAALAASTEGWIAALQLAALSLQEREDIPGFLRTFTAGAHRSLTAYLAEEVLQQQPPAVQTFLLCTSILDRLSDPLCAAVVGEKEAARHQPHGEPSRPGMLEQLERANLFLVPLDAECSWYRYHHLFAEFLRERLRRTHPALIPSLHRRAVLWYEQAHLVAEAIPHALAAADFNHAARLILQIGESMIARGEVTTLRQWLDALPETLLHAHPLLCLLSAWTCATMGQYESVENWLQEAGRGVDALSSGAPAAVVETLPVLPSETEQSRFLQHLRGEIAALRAHSAAFWGDIPASMRFAKQALEQLPPDQLVLRGLSALNLGVACWLSGDVRSASTALAEARALGLTTHTPYVVLLATCGLAQVQMAQGRRHDASTTSQEALRLAAEGGASLPAAAYAYVGMGLVHYEWNDLEAASAMLEQGIALSERWGNGEVLVYGYTELALVRQAQGDTEGALALIRRAERAAQRFHQRSWIVAVMVAQQIRLLLRQGNLEAVSRWTEQANQEFVTTYAEVTRARIALAQGQSEQALALLARQVGEAASSGRNATVIEIRLLEALAYQQQADLPRAMQALEEALALAEPEGYIRLFVDEGAPLRQLLTRWRRHRPQQPLAASQQRWRRYVGDLLDAFAADAQALRQRAARPQPEGGQRPLSTREREIMRHLAAGKSNEEIAAALVLEVSTVKWHLKHIYSKLQVHSRTQAILQANTLHLL